jgi:hypothetical protein
MKGTIYGNSAAAQWSDAAPEQFTDKLRLQCGIFPLGKCRFVLTLTKTDRLELNSEHIMEVLWEPAQQQVPLRR